MLAYEIYNVYLCGIMKKFSLLILALLLSATLVAQVRVACIGNSITYGSGIKDREHDTYPAQLQVLLGEGYDVRNFGVSGCTAQRAGDKPWTQMKEYEEAKAFLPQVAVIKLGTNDTKPQNWKGSEPFIRDLEALAREFESLPSHPKVIIALPATAYEVKWGIRDSVIRVGELKPIRKMAKRNKWALVDLHKATAKMPERFPDGIHPDPKGAGIIADRVMRAIRKLKK